MSENIVSTTKTTTAEIDTVIENIFHSVYTTCSHWISSIIISQVLVLVLVYLIVRQVLKYFEKKNNLQVKEENKSNKPNNQVQNEIVKEEEVKAEEEEKEEEEVNSSEINESEDENEGLFKKPNKAFAADTDDFVCPFSLMSIKELEKLKVDGLFDKPFRPLNADGSPSFAPFVKDFYKKDFPPQHSTLKSKEKEHIPTSNPLIQPAKEIKNTSKPTENSSTNEELEIQKQQMELIYKLIKQTQTQIDQELSFAKKEDGNDAEEEIKSLVESQMKLYGLK